MSKLLVRFPVVPLVVAVAVPSLNALPSAGQDVAGPPMATNGDHRPTFPDELVRFQPAPGNPVFRAGGAGHWDVMIRERGWILKTGDLWRLWFTGYDGTRAGLKMLGYATSTDGIHWKRHPANPIYRADWVEDVMVVQHNGTFFMFAEGRRDQAQLLTSPDGVGWSRVGRLDVRNTAGNPIAPGPYGTPTAWFEDGAWYLFYERYDAGVWLATSTDMAVWTNVSDEPVLKPGPAPYDGQYIALNQIIKCDGRYYGYYHGRGGTAPYDKWCTNVATSTDLQHWQKYPGNPLQPVRENKSSGIVVHDGRQYRLYTMHRRVELHLPVAKRVSDGQRRCPGPADHPG